ncbi:isoprenyl transferase [Larkinella soli]|uniref:isoprenyl transferase n=1 Tax=Larkinella soli TaxID=1770527 RepID=UPI000FFB2AAD|nr:isoprenyl transferase [Larkinella soli]
MKELIDLSNLPRHIAVIMDGNGRWAKRQGAARVFGHRNAIKSVREVTEGCAELGVKYLTLYTFSTENWARPKYEIDALMQLLVHTIRSEIPTLMENNVRLSTIGSIDTLPGDCRSELSEAMRMTEQNDGLNLILALSYSGKWDILEATRKIARQVEQGTLSPDQIDEELFSHSLATDGIDDVDLMIRTGGDHRISNFMLWQLAYAELYIIENVLWPDFRKPHLWEAILAYQNRERRFGKTSEQLVK